MTAQSWILISHRSVCQILYYENMLMRIYSEALSDQQRCPQEWENIIKIECDELRQDLSSMLN